ncbi:SGNH/GDSL hydrolase family protein [Acinetobacter sp. ANC 3781]|uniref:SGNH/GDSL hydrolase family protein n=1 Tax=Acinetobacter sp. ANC 3781 TaxID=2529835 RepID=UPI00103B666C|nr:SGNH/GDSL hydrolase family protein [Acinetobacter sp. ANC 3781]TCB80138.1 SGNH/GDSL hydrolase family protein [Acinetobacter sp. ANC 3781]
MAVPEETPYIEYVANGSTTEFALGFYCINDSELIVTINEIEPLVGEWELIDGYIKFLIAPPVNSLIAIKRNSTLSRTSDYQTYDNSLRPQSINVDFDQIWRVLQEFALQNSLTQIKFQELIDQLINGNINGLPAEILARIAGDAANSILINQEALRAYSVEQNLEYSVQVEKDRAIEAEQNLQTQVNVIGVGNKGYKTYALMDADKANIPANFKVTVTNDATSSNNGDWQWDGVVFTKSVYDPITQSNNFTKSLLPTVLRENMYNSANNTSGFYLRPADGFIIGQAGNAITSVAVEAGKTYALYAADVRSAYLIVSYSTTNSVSGGKQNTLATLNSTADPNIKTFTVPANMKFAFINVLWPNFSFDIRGSLVVQEGSTIEYVVKQANGVGVFDSSAQKRLDDLDAAGVVVRSDVLPSYTGPAVAKVAHTGLNVTPANGLLRTATGTDIAQFNITEGKRYLIKAPDLRAAYVAVSVSPTTDVFGGKPQTLVTLTEIDATTKIFTAPPNMKSACINTLWSNFTLDIRTTLVIEELEALEVTKILGVPVTDKAAQQKIKALEDGGAGSGYVSILKNKSVVWIGDSITDDANGWATKRYHDIIVETVGGMTTQNLGVSSSGFGNRTTAASYITLENPDYIIPFMGTNDFGVLNRERNASGLAYEMGDFLSSTHLTVSGAINLTLTNIFAAYPLAKIGIITPLPRGTRAGGIEFPSPNWGENPPKNVDGVSLEDIANELIRYAKHYSLPILDLYHHSNFKAWSIPFQNACMTDGVHPNDLGHAIIGQKILKFMESL